MLFVKHILFGLAPVICLMVHHGSLFATPPSVQIYQVSTPYSIILPGQQVFLRARFSDQDFGETFDIKWDLGDGTTLNETIKTTRDGYANPGRCTPYRHGCFSCLNTHYSYKSPGSYLITLTVTDSKSERGGDERTLEVVSPVEVVEKLLAVLKDTPLEAFNTRDELVHALDRVYENLEKEPVLTLGIIKTNIMPNLAGPYYRNKPEKKLMEVLPLFDALINYLALQGAS